MSTPISVGDPQVTPSSRGLRAQLARLGSSSFLRNVGILSSGTAIGHLFTLAAAPILTRVYGPSDFGTLGLFTSFLGIAGSAVGLQYEVGIVAGKDESESAYLTFGAVLFTLPLSVLSGLLLYALIKFSWLGFGPLPTYTAWLMGFAMAFLGLFTALRYWALRESEFTQIAQGLVVQSGGRAVLQALLGFVGFHSSGMLFGETLGRCMGMSQMLRSAWPVLKTRLKSFSTEEFRRVLYINRKFPLYSLPSSFLNAVCMGLSLPLLTRAYGIATGGYYSLVWKAITVPSLLVTAAVADAFHSHVAACAREAPDKIMGLFRRTSAALLGLGIVPTVVLWVWGPPLFGWIFGSQWRLSGTMAAIVAPWYLAQFIVGPLSRVVVVLSGQEMKLAWDVLSLAALLSIFLVPQLRGVAALQTIKILSAVSTILMIIYYFVLVRIIVRYNQVRSTAAPVP